MAILLLALAITVLSLLGGLAPRAFSGRLSGKQLEVLTGVASGLLLASALMVVIPEGFHTAVVSDVEVHDEHSELADPHDADEHDADQHSNEEAGFTHDAEEPIHLEEGSGFVYSPELLGLTILAGFVAMLLLEGFGVGHAVHEEHHDHADGHGHGHVHHPTSMPVLVIGLSAHALADGLAIGAAAVAGDTAVSMLVAFAVLLHRVPAAFSLGLFALHETEDISAATRGLFAFALATPVAMLLAYVLLNGASQGVVALTLLFSAGTFVYVATVDTLPAIHNPEIGRSSVRNVIIGVVLFTAVLFLASATGVLEHAH